MGRSIRIHTANWLTGGVHVLILYGAVHAESAAVWPYALGLMSLVSFAAWIGNYRRLRHIADTPLSNIATAAQGYVELAGLAETPGGTPIRSKLSMTPCVWYQYEVYEKSSRDEWDLEDSGTSSEPFVIADKGAQCVIDPEGAEVICARKKTWTHGRYRYTEWLLLPHERIYALGNFVTVGGANSDLDPESDVSELLAEWKKDQPELLKRFDLDRSGTLDLKEWELARRQAIREVEANHREIRSSPGINVLRSPTDGRLFLLSNDTPKNIRFKFELWAWAHAVIFVVAGGSLFALL
jgi:hypothetical protein